MADLSKKIGTISYEFLQIMPTIYKIQMDPDRNASEKRDECRLVAISALNQVKSVSDSTYARKREELVRAQTDNDIVRILERTIENGKNYVRQ